MRGISFVGVSVLGSLLAFANNASAADLPPQAPPPYRAPATIVAERYNWTGVYVGVHGGWGQDKLTGTDLTFGSGASSGSLKGGLAGGQIGANYQMGNIVVGIQGDAAWTDIANKQSGAAALGLGSSFKMSNDYLATVSGRVGVAFDQLLIYGKGGVAFTRDKLQVSDGVGGSASGSWSRTGWLAGAGVEWAFYGNWSAFAEYDYMGFSAITETPTVIPGPFLLAVSTNSVSAKLQIAKAGINYRF